MHPLSAKAEHSVPPPAPKETITLEIQRIRRDGGTQGRVSLNQSVVEEYAELTRVGTEFPPVRVWFDGDNYWLSDGFQRVVAAEISGVAKISAEVFLGSLEDARWDCYAANSCHGVRRSRADLEAIIVRTLEHPKASRLSNREISRHLNIPESTLRRWRKCSSAPRGADTIRTAVRAGQTYSIETANIMKGAERRRITRPSLDSLRSEFNNIKHLASPEGQLLLTIFGNWIFGGAPATVCLERIEETVRELRRPFAQRGRLASSVKVS
jgi:hypothetical protein